MIIYSESYHIEYTIEEKWLDWVKNVLIPEIYQLRRITKIVFSKVVSHTDESGNTYSLQYYVEDKKILEDFYAYDSPKITQLVFNMFRDKALPFKTELEIIETYDF